MKNEIRLAHSLVHAERWVEAWAVINKLLNEDPDRPEILYLAGCACRGLGHIGMGLPLLAKALAKEQNQPNLWMQYAATMHDLNKWDEGIEAFNIVHRMLPDDPMPIANISAALVQKGKWNDCINKADDALMLEPTNHIAHISKGFACLALGRWKDAWEHSEYLYGNHLHVRIYREPGNEEPMWDGSKGKTVVVQCDQGVGDIIMFAQCLTEMIRDCKQVIVECAERMVPVFHGMFPDLHIYGTLKDEKQSWSMNYEIDASIHLSYLGKFYRKKDSDFPRKPYLKAEPILVEKWKHYLSRFPRPWIGLAWQGGIQQTMKHLRSITLEDYRPIIELGGTFVDLSYHDSEPEVALWNIENPAHQVVKPYVHKDNFADTIALIAALDEVVCVTTTVAHVCGALGRSAYVVVPQVPTWRYAYKFGDGNQMIWYPPGSVELFRRKPGEVEWEPTIKRIAKVMSKIKMLKAA